jgi:AcrR family transcriptional regulator
LQDLAKPSRDGRKRRVPADERRKQILLTARQIILRDGISALNMSAIADALEVAKPIVYKHFHNTEDVIIALLQEYMAGTVRAVSKHLSKIETVDEFFEIAIDALFDYVKVYGAVVRSITSGFSSSSNIDACVRSMEGRSLRVYRHLLVQQGVSDKQARIAAYTLSAMINSTIYQYASADDPEHRKILKDMVAGTLRALIKTQRVRPSLPDDILVDTEDGRVPQ